MLTIRSFLRRSKQDSDKNHALVQEPQAQKEADAAEPSIDPASVNEILVVSSDFANDIISDVPDQSVEEIASDVNKMALRDISKSSPKPLVSGKRKRQEADVVEGPPRKRVWKDGDATGNGEEPPATSTNDATGHEGRSHRASLEAVPSGNLRRPKTKAKQHTIQKQSVSQKSVDDFEVPSSSEEQVEKLASVPTTGAVASTETTPRGRGRPPKNGQRKKSQELQAKPGRKRRSEVHTGPETETQQRVEGPAECSPQNVGPKTRSKDSRANENSKSTRSTATANGYKGVCSNKNTEEMALRAGNGDSPAQATAKKASSRGRKDYVPNVEVGQNLQDQVINAQYEGEKKQGDDFNREGSKGSQETLDRDGKISTQIVEGEQGCAEVGEDNDDDVEDPVEASKSEESEESEEEEEEEEEEEGEEEGEEIPELFGRDKAWTTVLEGARSVCGPKLPLNKMPNLFTGRMKELIQEVSKARKSYDQLLSFQDPIDGLDEDLRESLDAIEGQIKTLSEKTLSEKTLSEKTLSEKTLSEKTLLEKTAASEGRKMIRDIFARAIPAMVFLLRSALVSRVYHVDGPCDLKTLNETVARLREIIRLQNMTISLCEKAKNWVAKPVSNTKRIIGPTTRHIYPSLKEIREAFSKVLREQDRKRKMKQNAVDYMLRQKETADSLQQTKQEAARKGEILRRRIRESREREDKRRRDIKRTFREVREDEARARTGSLEIHGHVESRKTWSDAEHEARARTGSLGVNGHVESRITWSDAEDLALYFQLEKGYAGDMTSKERYLNILNTRLLQHMLPEHIRERALYFKPTLLEQRGALEWISSID